MLLKQITLIIILFTGLHNCGFAQQKTKSKSTASKLTITSANITKGKQLISKSDCVACHKDQDKLLGPSYKQIADKYPLTQETLTYLSKKIKVGGSGVWGQIPMSPHPTLPQNELDDMVKYIMSLKKSK